MAALGLSDSVSIGIYSEFNASRPESKALDLGNGHAVPDDSAVPSQNLKPHVLMMQPAKYWNRCDTAHLVRPSESGSIFVQ